LADARLADARLADSPAASAAHMPLPGVAAMEVDEEAHSTTSSGASTASWRRSSSRPIRIIQRYISPNTSDARGTRDDAFELVAVWCSHTAAS